MARSQDAILPEPGESALFLVLRVRETAPPTARAPCARPRGCTRSPPPWPAALRAREAGPAHIARVVIEEAGRELEIVRHSHGRAAAGIDE